MIKSLKKRQDLESDARLNKAYYQFQKLLTELSKKSLPPALITKINSLVDEINAESDSGKVLKKLLRKNQSTIIAIVEKELKIVPQRYYMNRWLAFGMVIFGIPFGVAFGMSLQNLAFIGIGMPIGMAVGIAIGTSLDNKAKAEGRQFDIVIEV